MDTEKNRPVRKKRTLFSGKTAEPEPETEEIPPKPFFKKRLIIQLLTVAAVVLAIAIGCSIFFSVDTVMVAGADKYDVQTVIDASGIEEGDSLLFLAEGQAAARIKNALPYVKSVSFQRKLPGTVIIRIEESVVAYTLQAADGTYWNITSEGTVVEKVTSDDQVGTTITGVTLDSPTVGEQAVAKESTTTQQVTTAQVRLQAALDVVTQLEQWEMFTKVTDVNVSDPQGIRISCSGNYRIELGDTQDLSDKIGVVKEALADQEARGSNGGVLEPYYKQNGVNGGPGWVVEYSPWT